MLSQVVECSSDLNVYCKIVNYQFLCIIQCQNITAWCRQYRSAAVTACHLLSVDAFTLSTPFSYDALSVDRCAFRILTAFSLFRIHWQCCNFHISANIFFGWWNDKLNSLQNSFLYTPTLTHISQLLWHSSLYRSYIRFMLRSDPRKFLLVSSLV